MNYFVTAIGTDSGKTLVSAILCEALGADYWKPVQSGTPRDAEVIARLISNKKTVIHPERFLLGSPVSPHAAARADGVQISLDDFVLPATANNLIVEGAGGCLVPLNDHDMMIDLIRKLKLETIVVCNLYLGSINHTLLTMEALASRNIIVKGLVFNGPPNVESERIILLRTKMKCLLHIEQEKAVNKETVTHYATLLKKNLNE